MFFARRLVPSTDLKGEYYETEENDTALSLVTYREHEIILLNLLHSLRVISLYKILYGFLLNRLFFLLARTESEHYS